MTDLWECKYILIQGLETLNIKITPHLEPDFVEPTDDAPSANKYQTNDWTMGSGGWSFRCITLPGFCNGHPDVGEFQAEEGGVLRDGF